MGVTGHYNTLATLRPGKEPPATLKGRLGVPLNLSANFGEEKLNVIMLH